MIERDEETGLGGARLLHADEVAGVLSGSYCASDDAGAESRARPSSAPRPPHYKVICISIYTKDLEHLDGLVGQLKARGITKANRSALIRVALDQLDLDRVPRGL